MSNKSSDKRTKKPPKDPFQGKVQRVDAPLTRRFNYILNGVYLDFSLRVDTKKELEAYVQLLDAAKKDVQEELEKLK